MDPKLSRVTLLALASLVFSCHNLYICFQQARSALIQDIRDSLTPFGSSSNHHGSSKQQIAWVTESRLCVACEEATVPLSTEKMDFRYSASKDSTMTYNTTCANLIRWKLLQNEEDDGREGRLDQTAANSTTVARLQFVQDEVSQIYDECRICAASPSISLIPPTESTANTEATTTTKKSSATSAITCSSNLIVQNIGYDEAAPPILAAVTPSLRSKPNRYQIPEDILADWDHTLKYIQHNVTGKNGHLLFTFNPSIVHAPQNIRNEVPPAAYLASFRISAASGCVGDTYHYWDHANTTFLGLAILDRDLKILHDAIFDVNGDLPIRQHGILEDHRLFYLPWQQHEGSQPTLHLFLSSGKLVVPIHVSTRTNLDKDEIVKYAYQVRYLDGSRRSSREETREDDSSVGNKNKRSSNRFNSLVLRVPKRDATIRILSETKTLDKNYQFFPSEAYLASAQGKDFGNSSTTSPWSSSFILEEWPEGPRQLRQLSTNFRLMMKAPRHDTEYVPSPTYIGPEDSLNQTWRFRQRGRGSACCIQIPRSLWESMANQSYPSSSFLDSHFLWVGIEHVQSLPKTLPDGTKPGARSYVSRFYAFSPISPYPLVARSGLFCLGLTTATEQQQQHEINDKNINGRNNTDANDDSVRTPSNDPFSMPSSVIPRTKVLRLGDDVVYPTCPKIGYVSGMTEVVDDDSKVIIGYGINDCSPRFVVVSKLSISERVFLPPALWTTTATTTTTTTTTTSQTRATMREA